MYRPRRPLWHLERKTPPIRGCVPECELLSDKNVTIKYINNGYYDNVIEYTGIDETAIFSIGQHNFQQTQCTVQLATYSINDTMIIEPSHIYTAEELAVLNKD